MPIKIITATAFKGAFEINDDGIIIKAPKQFVNFLNHPISTLEDFLYKQKIAKVTIENIEEVE